MFEPFRADADYCRGGVGLVDVVVVAVVSGLVEVIVVAVVSGLVIVGDLAIVVSVGIVVGDDLVAVVVGVGLVPFLGGLFAVVNGVPTHCWLWITVSRPVLKLDR